MAESFYVDEDGNSESNTKVCDLVLNDNKPWDENKVRTTFSNTNVETNFAIHIPQNSTQDMID